MKIQYGAATKAQSSVCFSLDLETSKRNCLADPRALTKVWTRSRSFKAVYHRSGCEDAVTETRHNFAACVFITVHYINLEDTYGGVTALNENDSDSTECSRAQIRSLEKQRSICKSILTVHTHGHVFISHAHNVGFLFTNYTFIIYMVDS